MTLHSRMYVLLGPKDYYSLVLDVIKWTKQMANSLIC